VAELLRINRKTAYKLAADGEIPASRSEHLNGSTGKIANWIKRDVKEQQAGPINVITEYHAKLFAHELGRRHSVADAAKLAVLCSTRRSI
jgi:helix-turn-helix protein